MMMAEVGGSTVVRGSRIALRAEGPMPGSTQIMVPIRHPTKAHRRFCKVKAVTNP